MLLVSVHSAYTAERPLPLLTLLSLPIPHLNHHQAAKKLRYLNDAQQAFEAALQLVQDPSMPAHERMSMTARCKLNLALVWSARSDDCAIALFEEVSPFQYFSPCGEEKCCPSISSIPLIALSRQYKAFAP